MEVKKSFVSGPSSLRKKEGRGVQEFLLLPSGTLHPVQVTLTSHYPNKDRFACNATVGMVAYCLYGVLWLVVKNQRKFLVQRGKIASIPLGTEYRWELTKNCTRAVLLVVSTPKWTEEQHHIVR